MNCDIVFSWSSFCYENIGQNTELKRYETKVPLKALAIISSILYLCFLSGRLNIYNIFVFFLDKYHKKSSLKRIIFVTIFGKIFVTYFKILFYIKPYFSIYQIWEILTQGFFQTCYYSTTDYRKSEFTVPKFTSIKKINHLKNIQAMHLDVKN